MHGKENTRTEITLRKDTHVEKTHSERGHKRTKDTYGAGTHMKGWNIYGKGNTRIREYTAKGEGTNMGGEKILMEEVGEIYMVRRVYGTGIT